VNPSSKLSLIAILWPILLCAPSFAQVSLSAKEGDLIRSGLHEPVFVTVILSNRSDHPATVDPGWDGRSHYLLTVTSPTGVTSDVPPLFLDGPESPGPIHVSPGGSVTAALLLNDWIAFDSVGLYTVVIRLDGANPATINVQVGPRDPSGIHDSCDRLLSASKGDDFRSAWMAARALATVRDDQALPYLTTLAQGGDFVIDAVDGLIGIASDDSFQMLERVIAQRADPILAEHARMRLNQLRLTDIPQSTRLRIGRVLSTLSTTRSAH
jgi:hypothetical protein